MGRFACVYLYMYICICVRVHVCICLSMGIPVSTLMSRILSRGYIYVIPPNIWLYVRQIKPIHMLDPIRPKLRISAPILPKNSNHKTFESIIQRNLRQMKEDWWHQKGKMLTRQRAEKTLKIFSFVKEVFCLMVIVIAVFL